MDTRTRTARIARVIGALGWGILIILGLSTLGSTRASSEELRCAATAFDSKATKGSDYVATIADPALYRQASGDLQESAEPRPDRILVMAVSESCAECGRLLEEILDGIKGQSTTARQLWLVDVDGSGAWLRELLDRVELPSQLAVKNLVPIRPAEYRLRLGSVAIPFISLATPERKVIAQLVGWPLPGDVATLLRMWDARREEIEGADAYVVLGMPTPPRRGATSASAVGSGEALPDTSTAVCTLSGPVNLDLALFGMSGQPVRFEDLAGVATLVHITASSVAIGAGDLRLLRAGTRGMTGARVISILLDPDLETARRFVRRRAVEHEVVWTQYPAQLRAQLAAVMPGMPTTLVLDSRRHLCTALPGKLTPERISYALEAAASR